jgi:diacylglycerol O-acyltransferase
MSAWEALMWRAESDPRTSSTGILLEILEGEPSWPALLEAHRRTVKRFPRLRECVVEPPVPLVQPAWSAVPDFDVALHLRHEPLAPGETILELCERTMKHPLDAACPPWEAILVTGLPDGRAAYLFRFHHSLTDGLGLIQLLDLAHGPAPAESTIDGGATPVERPSVTPASLLANRLARHTFEAPARLAQRMTQGVDDVRRVATRPSESVRSGIDFMGSLGRMLSGAPAPGSPLLSDRTLGNRFLTLDVDLEELKFAARVAGGSINDAFVAAVLGGLRRFHAEHGTMVETLPLAMPVSLRRENDPLGGNRFAGARIAAPLAEPDAAVRIRMIKDMVLEARDEPAIGFLDNLSPVLTKLPTSAIIELSASMMAASDLQVSNIRGLSHSVQLAGQKVLGMYPLGPRPGVAAMVAMITYDGTCCLGFNLDPKVFPDIEQINRCLTEGFAEVLAIGDSVSTPERVQHP